MKTTVIGTGYASLVIGARLAEVGNHAVCLDVEASNIKALQAGSTPILEPGLDVLVQRNAAGAGCNSPPALPPRWPAARSNSSGSARRPARMARPTCNNPVAMPQARHALRGVAGVMFAADQTSALAGADALLIVSEWRAYRSHDFEYIRATLKQAAIFDGRNLFDPGVAKAQGIEYFAVGRTGSLQRPVPT